MFRFTIRDVLWLTLVTAVAVMWYLAERRSERENEALVRDNLVKAQELEVNKQLLETAAKKEKNLQKEVELLGQIRQAQASVLKRREAELRDSLDRREAVLDALRTIGNAPPLPMN